MRRMTTSKKAPDVAERLKAAREGRGLTVAELARRTVVEGTEISRQAVMKIEGGDVTNPGILTVEGLAVALDVPSEWLAYGVGPTPAGLTAPEAVTRRGAGR